jgi:multidrug efflux pump subunit AcrB
MATNVAMAGVFLAFMGDRRALFLEFAIMMTFAILASTFVGLTVVPMLASRLLKGNRHSLVPRFQPDREVSVRSTVG